MKQHLDQIKRERFLKKELRLKTLKTLYHDLSLPKSVRQKAQVQIAKLRKSTKVKIRNRCFISGRSRAVYRKIGLSRIMIRELGHEGGIIGMYKASW